MKQHLQTMVNEAAAASGAVGLQVSVILGDESADFTYGSANAELNTPMTVDTIIQVGSVTKIFNAAIIMTLVEEGKLDLDLPVATYVPNFAISDKQAQRTITLRHLISMSSGLDNGPYTEHGSNADALAQYVASLHDIPQAFPPGQGFGYSNAGTSIAGYAAELVAGERWDTLLKKRILEPAGLLHAATLAEDLPYQRVAVAHSPSENGKPPNVIRPWYLTRAQAPAGSTLAMSAQDLATFGQIFVSEGKAANGNRVLSEASIRAMMTPTTDVPIEAPMFNVGKKWGLGPSMGYWGSTLMWGHSGGNQSGRSQLLWFPEKRGVLALITNAPASMSAITERIFGDFSQEVFGVKTAATVAPEPPLALENPKRFVGTYASFGMRYEVSENGDQLGIKETNVGRGSVGEVNGTITESRLLPLGGDRFLMRDQELREDVPVGFFGKDAEGHATNFVAPVFAVRRVT